MKTIALFALSVVATAAMATGPAPVAEIKIDGTSIQIAALSNSGVVNQANGTNSLAQQNLASNTGDVTIDGTSVQIVAGRGSLVWNKADANAEAQQNLSSNVGNVTIGGDSLQATLLKNSFVGNFATGSNSLAVQNVATNNACFTCVQSGSNSGGSGGHHH